MKNKGRKGIKDENPEKKNVPIKGFINYTSAKSHKKKQFAILRRFWREEKEKVGKKQKGGGGKVGKEDILTWEFELGGLNIDIIPSIHFCRP